MGTEIIDQGEEAIGLPTGSSRFVDGSVRLEATTRDTVQREVRARSLSSSNLYVLRKPVIKKID